MSVCRNLLLCFLFLLCGCDDEPPSPQELKTLAVEAAAEAKTAGENGDADGAKEAADRATDALKQIKAIKKEDTSTDEPKVDPELVKEVDRAARDAAKYAALAAEKKSLEKRLNGWKGKAYRTARTAPLKLVLKGMSLAADQAAKGNLSALPQSVQDSAKSAAELVESIGGPARNEDGSLDWQGISKTLSDASETPPAALHELLAASMLMTGSFDLALFEIASIDESKIETKRQRIEFHGLRAMVYFAQGFGHLAMQDMEVAMGKTDGIDLDPQTMAGMHIVGAMIYLYHKEYIQADRSLAAANRTWPNNPIAVYLTGERLAANGEYEKAVESLENAAQGTDHQWLADKITERVKHLRDNPNQLDPIAFDPTFVREVAWAYVKSAATKSKPMDHIKKWLTAAKDFGGKMMGKLPKLEMPSLPKFSSDGDETPKPDDDDDD